MYGDNGRPLAINAWDAKLHELEAKNAELTRQLAEAQALVRWRDVADEKPTEAMEVLFVRDNKVLHGAWIAGIFWHSNTKMAAAKWMPLPPAEINTAALQSAIDAAVAEEREAILQKLQELGALGDGTFMEAIRERGVK